MFDHLATQLTALRDTMRSATSDKSQLVSQLQKQLRESVAKQTVSRDPLL